MSLCPCGRVVQPNNLKNHLLTNYHINRTQIKAHTNNNILIEEELRNSLSDALAREEILKNKIISLEHDLSDYNYIRDFATFLEELRTLFKYKDFTKCKMESCIETLIANTNPNSFEKKMMLFSLFNSERCIRLTNYMRAQNKYPSPDSMTSLFTQLRWHRNDLAHETL